MQLGFVGLGQMGKPMAVNMLKSGAGLIVNDIRTDCFPELAKLGISTTSHLAEIAQADVIFLSLPDSDIVKRIVLSESGLFNYLTEGQIIVDLSTVTYTATIELARHLAARGVVFIDAPVSGMAARAIDGTLTVMCGGPEAAVATVTPYLECIGNKILYMGDSGSGQLTKLINQLLFDINAAALAEILPMAAKMGLDPDKVGQVVNSGTGRSYASEFFIPRMLKGSFAEGYLMKHAYKDLVSAAEIGANHCIALPVLNAAISTYQMALLKGYGDQDKGAMVKVFEELLGVSYRAR